MTRKHQLIMGSWHVLHWIFNFADCFLIPWWYSPSLHNMFFVAFAVFFFSVFVLLLSFLDLDDGVIIDTSVSPWLIETSARIASQPSLITSDKSKRVFSWNVGDWMLGRPLALTDQATAKNICNHKKHENHIKNYKISWLTPQQSTLQTHLPPKIVHPSSTQPSQYFWAAAWYPWMPLSWLICNNTSSNTKFSFNGSRRKNELCYITFWGMIYFPQISQPLHPGKAKNKCVFHCAGMQFFILCQISALI